MLFKVRYKRIRRNRKYRVGSDGSVWRLWRKYRGTPKRWKRLKLHKIGKPSSKGQQYLQVALSKNGKKKRYVVHRLVLEAFKGPCPDNHEACHRDGIRFNNNWWNLYWGTRKQNIKDKIRHGSHLLVPRGENQGNAKLTDAKVKRARRLHAKNPKKYPIEKLRIMFGVTSTPMWKAIVGITWKHIALEEK